MRSGGRNDQDVFETGQRIREIREERKMSQDGLAELMGTDRTNVSKHENGSCEMKIGTLFQYADVLQVHPAKLLPKRFPMNENRTTAAERVFKLMQNLPEEDCAYLVSLAERLAKRVD